MELEKLAQKVSQNLQEKALSGHIIVLKIRFADFTTQTKRLSLGEKVNGTKEIAISAIKLLNSINLENKSVRLLGITVSGL